MVSPPPHNPFTPSSAAASAARIEGRAHLARRAFLPPLPRRERTEVRVIPPGAGQASAPPPQLNPFTPDCFWMGSPPSSTPFTPSSAAASAARIEGPAHLSRRAFLPPLPRRERTEVRVIPSGAGQGSAPPPQLNPFTTDCFWMVSPPPPAQPVHPRLLLNRPPHNRSPRVAPPLRRRVSRGAHTSPAAPSCLLSLDGRGLR